MGKNWRGKKDFVHSGARGKGGSGGSAGGGGRGPASNVNGITSCRGYAVIVGTCDTVREREANKELVNLLTQGIEDMIEAGELPERCIEEGSWKGKHDSTTTTTTTTPAASSSGEGGGGGAFSIEDLLALELAEARGEGGVASGGGSGASNASVVHSVNLDMRGLLIVKILRRDVCPVKLLSFIFNTIRKERQAHSKHLIRLVPGMRCFFPNDVELVANVRGLLRDICVSVALPPIALPVIALPAISPSESSRQVGENSVDAATVEEETAVEEGQEEQGSCSGRKRPRGATAAADDDEEDDGGDDKDDASIATAGVSVEQAAAAGGAAGAEAEAEACASTTHTAAIESHKGSKRRNGDRRPQAPDAAHVDKATILLLREQRKKLKRDKAAAVAAQDRTEGSDVINKVLAVEAIYAARAQREKENALLQSADTANHSSGSGDGGGSSSGEKHALLRPFSYEVSVKLRHHNTLKQGTARSWAVRNMPAAATANFRKPEFVLAIEAIKNIACISFVPSALLEEYRDFHIRKFSEEFAPAAATSGSSSSGIGGGLTVAGSGDFSGEGGSAAALGSNADASASEDSDEEDGSGSGSGSGEDSD